MEWPDYPEDAPARRSVDPVECVLNVLERVNQEGSAEEGAVPSVGEFKENVPGRTIPLATASRLRLSLLLGNLLLSLLVACLCSYRLMI